jgi:hypothetical protein
MKGRSLLEIDLPIRVEAARVGATELAVNISTEPLKDTILSMALTH